MKLQDLRRTVCSGAAGSCCTQCAAVLGQSAAAAAGLGQCAAAAGLGGGNCVSG